MIFLPPMEDINLGMRQSPLGPSRFLPPMEDINHLASVGTLGWDFFLPPMEDINPGSFFYAHPIYETFYLQWRTQTSTSMPSRDGSMPFLPPMEDINPTRQRSGEQGSLLFLPPMEDINRSAGGQRDLVSIFLPPMEDINAFG